VYGIHYINVFNARFRKKEPERRFGRQKVPVRSDFTRALVDTLYEVGTLAVDG